MMTAGFACCYGTVAAGVTWISDRGVGLKHTYKIASPVVWEGEMQVGNGRGYNHCEYNACSSKLCS